MDFSGLTNDELADAAKALVDEAHLRVDALPQSAFRSGVSKRLDVAHKALDFLKEHLVGGGVISPQSGGDPKP